MERKTISISSFFALVYGIMTAPSGKNISFPHYLQNVNEVQYMNSNQGVIWSGLALPQIDVNGLIKAV